MALGDTILGTRAVYEQPIEVGGGELVRVAKVDTHGTVTCSRAAAAVAVKWMVDLDSRTYNEDQMRERESRGAHVVASHGELKLGGGPRPWWWRRLRMWPHLGSSGYNGGSRW